MDRNSNYGGQTSENVKEVVLSFLLLAAEIAEVAALALVANGTRINAMKNDDILAAVEKDCTLCMRGSARTDSIRIPANKSIMALNHAQVDLSTGPALVCSTNSSVSFQAFCIIMKCINTFNIVSRSQGIVFGEYLTQT